jgi:hypothetical protein
MEKGLREPVRLSKQVFDIAMGESKGKPLSKRCAGGLQSGRARAQHLTAEQGKTLHD